MTSKNLVDDRSDESEATPPRNGTFQDSVRVRVLESGNAGAYRELRLAALRDHPEAFAAAYDDELARSESEFATRITARPDQVTVGAFDGDRLVGVASLIRIGSAKEWHKGRVVGMYVSPDARGSGVGRGLLDRILEMAKEWGVSDVRLAVTVGNQSARNLYAAVGFTSYGVEPRSLRLDGRYYDVELMALELR